MMLNFLMTALHLLELGRLSTWQRLQRLTIHRVELLRSIGAMALIIALIPIAAMVI